VKKDCENVQRVKKVFDAHNMDFTITTKLEFFTTYLEVFMRLGSVGGSSISPGGHAFPKPIL
jgi:hypothetical protein